MRIVVLAVGLLLIALATSLLMRQGSLRDGEIMPAGELGEQYDRTANARPEITIDPASVPENLRDLIPMAEFWGVGDDVIRGDIEERSSVEQRQAFQSALRGRTAEVTAWLDSYGDTVMPDAAGHYMYMLEALDEMGIWPD